MTDGTGPANPADPPATWPKDMQRFSYANALRLGVGKDGQLYWDGRPVETKRGIKFSRLQLAAAIAVGGATFIGSLGSVLNEGFEFVCKVHWLQQGCKQ